MLALPSRRWLSTRSSTCWAAPARRKRDGGGCWEADFASKAPPKPTRKPVLGWLVSAGYTKKGSEIECTSKLVPRFQIFFLARFTRAITHSVIGLPSLLGGIARGGAPFFLREKRAGFRARFAAAKRRPLTHKSTQRQSGRQRRPGLRSKLKKGLEAERELAHRSTSKPFFNQTAALQTQPIPMLDWFLCYFLWLKESNVSPSPAYIFLSIFLSTRRNIHRHSTSAVTSAMGKHHQTSSAPPMRLSTHAAGTSTTS